VAAARLAERFQVGETVSEIEILQCARACGCVGGEIEEELRAVRSKLAMATRSVEAMAVEYASPHEESVAEEGYGGPTRLGVEAGRAFYGEEVGDGCPDVCRRFGSLAV